MELTDIRRLVIIAMFSDDVLLERLVLKGGSALELVHGIVARGSVDVDFSLENDFEDVGDIERRVLAALKDRFDSKGYEVFDYEFRSIPPDHQLHWGGYRAQFKVIGKNKIRGFEKYDDEARLLEQMRREADVIAPAAQKRIFRVEMSKYEFCRGNVEVSLNDYAVRVYTPEMIAIEKLRALCQQLPDYPLRKKKTPRARDFYDLHEILTTRQIDLCSAGNIDLLENIFAAKDVPLSLLSKIEAEREFHRPEWPAVEAAVPGWVEPFDHYFDYVIEVIGRLQALGVVDSP